MAEQDKTLRHSHAAGELDKVAVAVLHDARADHAGIPRPLDENISTLSFLGLGVQAPTPEWGAMLNEAKNVMTSNPVQMIAPGIAIVVLVCVFNLMGDALRDVLDPKEVQK